MCDKYEVKCKSEYVRFFKTNELQAGLPRSPARSPARGYLGNRSTHAEALEAAAGAWRVGPVGS